jgi:hypothetical protein
MIQNTGKGGLYRYYCCSNKLKKGRSACRGLRTPMEKLDQIVVGEVARQVLDPGRLTAMLDAYVQSAAAQADGAKAQLAKLRHDHTAAVAGIARLLELVEKGLMEAEDPAMREPLVGLKLQRDQIAKEIVELQNRMASTTQTITPEKVAGSAARYQSHTSLTDIPARTACRSAEGSSPLATPASFSRAKSRALSDVSAPYWLGTSRRVRPSTFRYWMRKLFTPEGFTRTPKPLSSLSHVNTSRRLSGCSASTARLVILATIQSCSRVPCLFPNLLPRLGRRRSGKQRGSTGAKIAG